MNKRIYLSLFLAFLFPAINFSPISAGTNPAASSQVIIKVFHTNDIHANSYTIQSFGRISAFMSEQRKKHGAENVLLLDGGDLTVADEGGNCKAENTFLVDELFKYVGYNAVVVGNHELDCGMPILIGREKNDAPMALLAANLTRKDIHGKCTWEPFFDAYKIYKMGPETNQVKVAVIGLFISPPFVFDTTSVDMCVNHPVEALSRYYDIAKSEGSDAFIVLIHRGLRNSKNFRKNTAIDGMDGETLIKDMVKAGKPVNLVIGGHSHELFNVWVGQTLMAEAGEYAENIGIATLIIGKNTKQVNVQWTYKSFVPTDPQDPGIAEFIESYNYISPFELRHLLP
jgi:2',3'-cyclic-nucleotide 2'-phosphodiesterase (5'-nucleotidase family)